MAITGADIRNAGFSTNRKGYNYDEVDVFLERVADEIDLLNNEIADLQAQLAIRMADAADATVAPAIPAEPVAPAQAPEAAPAAEVSADADTPAADPALVGKLNDRIASLEAQLNEKAANDAAISQALVVAQRSADEIIANARTEASSIVQDADDEADRIVNKAEADRQRIIEAIRKLEFDRNEVRGEYREMLADFMADAQRKLADIDGDMRQAAANSQARTEANAVSYAPVDSLTASGMHAAKGNRVSAPAGVDPMPGGVPSETMAAHLMQSPSASGYVDKDFSGYGAADDDIDIDID